MVQEIESGPQELEAIKMKMSRLNGGEVDDFVDCIRVMSPVSELILAYNKKLGLKNVDFLIPGEDEDEDEEDKFEVLATAQFSFRTVTEEGDTGVIEKLCKDKDTEGLFLDSDFIPSESGSPDAEIAQNS